MPYRVSPQNQPFQISPVLALLDHPYYNWFQNNFLKSYAIHLTKFSQKTLEKCNNILYLLLLSIKLVHFLFIPPKIPIEIFTGYSNIISSYFNLLSLYYTTDSQNFLKFS